MDARWLSPLVVPALLAAVACGEAPAPTAPRAARPSAAVVVNTGKEPESTQPFFDQCTGEIVDLAGWGRTLSVETTDGAGGTHLVFHTDLWFTGIGRTTGAEYVGSQHVTTVTQGPLPSSRIVNATAQLISKGGLDNRLRSIRLRLVVNAQGEVVVDFADSELACR